MQTSMPTVGVEPTTLVYELAIYGSHERAVSTTNTLAHLNQRNKFVKIGSHHHII